MSLRTAIYARYSSDRQSPASIQDQLRKCRECAAEHQSEFQDGHIYTDEAVSGAGADRPGLLKLMAAGGPPPPPLPVFLVGGTHPPFPQIGGVGGGGGRG